MNKSIPPVVICCGGGLDSTALIHYYLTRGLTIQGIHFDYGQPACQAERKALRAISKHYKVLIDFANLRPIITPTATGEFQGRNAILVLSALNHLKSNKGLISLGLHEDSIYYDCTPIFTQHLQALLDGYFGGLVVLDVPFLSFSKEAIFEYCLQNEVPIELTYSCERSSDRPCGTCHSCLERNRYDLNE